MATRPNTRLILHIDFDSFFASVEQQHNPLLRNRPIGVTATNGRSCIVASSREAKRVGVKTAMNTRDALVLCPSITFVPADFWKYWEVSKRFVMICKDFSPDVEVFSIDELFMDVTASAHLFGGVDTLLERLKKRIKEEIGEYITVSVGVGPNKLLAKLASGLKKPNGIVKITPSNILSIYAVARLTDICGIGSRIEARLNQMGVFTLLQLHKTPLDSLIAEFGHVEGHFLKAVGMGDDIRPVVAFTRAPEVKSVGRQYCLAKNEHDQRIILQNIYELYEEVALKLRRLNKKTRSVGIYLSGAYSVTGHITTQAFVDHGDQLFGMGMQVLVREAGGLPVGYIRRIGVWAGYLEDAKSLTLPLFMEDRKKDTIVQLTDRLNDKFGTHTIRNGFLLKAKKLTTVPNGFMSDKYERAKLANADL